MMAINQASCGVVGNPVKHSLSPEIHFNFAKQFNINLDYQKYLVEPEQLETFIKNFFIKGGVGLNVTLPFKQSVIPFIDELSMASEMCGSVNTLSVKKDGSIKGDTTDGDGLLLHLKQLEYEVKGKTILILGAGGASISVIYALLKNQAKVILHNRSPDKIESLLHRFSDFGEIRAFDLNNENSGVDGLISAISQFNQPMFDQVVRVLKKDAFVYDLNYAERAEKTLNFFRKKGFTRLSDGYGMLVGQAAKSFEIWHGKMPVF